MFRLHLISYGTQFDVVGKCKILLPIAIFIMIISALFVSIKGLNYGIDFKGGYIFEVSMPSPPNIVELRQKLGGLSLGDVSIQQFGKEQDLLVKLEKSEEGSEQSEAVKKIKDVLGQDVVYKKIETVGPKVGSELIANAIKAVIFALIAMLGYIMLRFEWQFGVCAVAALVHDCAVIFGMFSIFPLEFNEMSITAILLTASYSVNDTVVIFDRIRENLKRFRKLNMKDVVNKSLNETLSRTTLTATTTLLAVFALYLLGGKVIAAFSLPILIGIIVGTFSSVFIASPLLVFMNIDRGDGDNRSTEEKQRAPANLQ